MAARGELIRVGFLLQAEGLGTWQAPCGQGRGVHDGFGPVEGATDGEVGGFEAVGGVGPGGKGELRAGRGCELMGEDVGGFGQGHAAVVAPGGQRHGGEQGVEGDGAGAAGR
ncbi:hypothetical protein ACFY15_31185 [Streptomyces sp. NPDC001373]|uniref:hypothetical protein n=1 Tax=Streptomyces sp. NPDC001373 TaxID=3364565 RepID=UPI0036AB5D01